MIDFNLYGTCNHRVQEIISIKGTSPDYYSDLNFTSNSNFTSTSIMELMLHDGATLFSANYQGITNFGFEDGGDRIRFGVNPVEATTIFPDSTELIPPNIYICSYVALSNNCPKCLGSKNNIDVHFDTAGRVQTLSEHDKVRQQLWKILLTLQGSNLLDTEYGSDLPNLIGFKIDDYLAARIQFSILGAVDHLIDTQVNLGLDDDERVISISDIEASLDKNDPRLIDIKVTVICADYAEVSSSISLQV